MKEKVNLLSKLESIKRKGIPLSRTFTMQNTLDDMKMEYMRLRAERERVNSVKFQRNMMMSFVSGVEFLNETMDPFDIKLSGWSESVHENINDYDDIFEELHEKYKDRAKMSPELRLMFSLGGSALMFHLTNKLLSSKMPSMNDVMSQNPDFMKQFTEAAGQRMAGQPPMAQSGMGGPPAPPRREMQEPPNIEEILKQADAPPRMSSPLSMNDRVETMSVVSGRTGKSIPVNGARNGARSINLDI